MFLEFKNILKMNCCVYASWKHPELSYSGENKILVLRQHHCLDIPSHKLDLLIREKSSETLKGGLFLNCVIILLSFLRKLDN